MLVNTCQHYLVSRFKGPLSCSKKEANRYTGCVFVRAGDEERETEAEIEEDFLILV